MDLVFRSLLIRYQNYLLEFYQLIEDKNDFTEEEKPLAENIRRFLENMPAFEDEFEVAFSLSKRTGNLTATWSVFISEDGFSVRSYSEDGLEELDEWFFHYHNDTKEYEGNLFTDGDWDLFLEEVAEVDDVNGEKISYQLEFKN